MIRVGFIGTGGICAAHLNYLKTRSDVAIAALCDVNRDNLERRQKEYGGDAFEDFATMLARVKLDAVWVCTPPQVRGAPLAACAKRGIPVFCEKPVERSLARAERIAAELKRHKARVQIGYVFRSMPIVERARREMADDKIHVVQSFYGNNAGLTRAMRAWFYDKKLSGGALVDQATHNFDLLRLLVGEVAAVRGFVSNPVAAKRKGYTIDEVISLSFRFGNGATGSHVHTWVGDTWRNELMLSGEKRHYRLDLGRGVLTVEDKDDTRTVRQNQSLMYTHQNARFLEMVASGDWRANPSDYADGVETLRLTLACDRAAMAR
jgi:myo-inositol 2-dehydrogenase / D-chiro-inositol 1-dehydrogenase